MTYADEPVPFPTDWPKPRYRAIRRAMKALRIADHLLRRGLAYAPADATNEVIRTAARECGQRHPSEATCALVRAVLDLLLTPHLADGPRPGAAGSTSSS